VVAHAAGQEGGEDGAGPVAAIAFAEIRPDKRAFSGVVRGDGVLPGLPVSRKGDLKEATERWPQVLEDWRTELERLGRAFCAGTAEVDPKNGLATCRNSYCELAALCRIHECPVDGGGDEEGMEDGGWRDD